MPKEVTHYICQSCGGEFPKWSGQCQGCSSWNSLVETVVSTKRHKNQESRIKNKPIKLSEVKLTRGPGSRVSTGIGEFDRVLGGGMVAGSAILLAGEPGIGKSTLLTQLALNSKQVLYVCGEESPSQVKLRFDRLNQESRIKNQGKDFLLLPETNTDAVVAQVLKLKPECLVIVDSIQTMHTGDLSGMAGSVGQIRESTNRLINVAKRGNIPMIIVGHVTKQGSIAGPKILEHMVDVVLSLEGEREHDFRILRANKNRFGAADEVGVFAMGDRGMVEVKNPSDVFLQERNKLVPGSCVVSTVTGLRPMLVEIQALVVPTQLAIPRRVSTGVDQRKVTVISAVLQKHCRLGLGGSDIFVNVAGGLKLSDPGIELGLALAIASGYLGKAVPKGAVAIGEVGLLGEIRRVSRLVAREKEARKLGYKTVISPERYKTLQEAVKRVLK